MNGAAYVGFVTENDYVAFRRIVLRVSRVLVDVQPTSEMRRLLRQPTYTQEAAAKGGYWAVGFPPDDIEAVTAAARG